MAFVGAFLFFCSLVHFLDGRQLGLIEFNRSAGTATFGTTAGFPQAELLSELIPQVHQGTDK